MGTNVNQPDRTSPYQGLAPFLESDAEYFVGREEDVRRIIAQLYGSRITVLYGSSGVGKSSVIEAGVARELRSRADVLFISFRDWQTNPTAGLKKAIHDAADTHAGHDVGLSTAKPLAELIEECSEKLGVRLMIVLDQFEEYFQYSEPDDPASFERQFPPTVNRSRLPVSFLISMREDSLAKLDVFEGKVRGLFDNPFRLSHLDEHSARRAIVEPVSRFAENNPGSTLPSDIEPELVDEVLKELKEVVVGDAAPGTQQVGESVATTDSRIETPFLQLVMERLWEEESRVGSRTIRLQTLIRLGDPPRRSGAEEIVRSHLERRLGGMTSEEERIAAVMFRYLVSPSGKIAYPVRGLIETEQLDRTSIDAVIARLTGEARILRSVGPAAGMPDDPEHERFEIFHDVIGPPILDWRRRYELRHHFDEDREKERQRRKRVVVYWGLGALVVGVAGLTAALLIILQQSNNLRESKVDVLSALDKAEESEVTAVAERVRADSQAVAASLAEDEANTSAVEADQAKTTAVAALVVADMEAEAARLAKDDAVASEETAVAERIRADLQAVAASLAEDEANTSAVEAELAKGAAEASEATAVAEKNRADLEADAAIASEATAVAALDEIEAILFSKGATLETVYSSLSVVNLRTDKSTYTSGEEVVISYELLNESTDELVVPSNDEDPPRYFVGVRQHWIERLGSDSTIAPYIDTSRAKVGARYAAGGAVISSGQTLVASQSLRFCSAVDCCMGVDTSDFPVGQYRYYVEYKRLDDLSVVQTATVDFTIDSH